MSTNPNNAVGTNAAYGGRTSVKAFNDNIGAYSRGILSGWACSPSSGMTVSLGGDGTTRDIAIAEDVSGNKITVNNISEAPISVTMSAAPASNSRIDLIVAYVDNPPQGSATALDNPAACGLITVNGTAAANPVAPNESAIRTAITADGASGSTAYYVILAQITIASGTTDIVAGNITAGSSAGIGAKNIDFATATVLFSNSDNIGSASRTVASYTIEKAGKYFIFMNADLNCLGLDLGDATLAIFKNSSNVQGVYFNNPQRAYFIGGIQLFTVQECNPGDIISVRGSCPQNKFSISTSANRSNLQIIRIS